MNFFKKLITNNTGFSSKNFFLIVVTCIGCLLLLVPAFALTYEVIKTSTIATNLDGFAAYIAAVGTLFATAGITKAWSEKYENENKGHDNFESFNEEQIEEANLEE